MPKSSPYGFGKIRKKVKKDYGLRMVRYFFSLIRIGQKLYNVLVLCHMNQSRRCEQSGEKNLADQTAQRDIESRNRSPSDPCLIPLKKFDLLYCKIDRNEI